MEREGIQRVKMFMAITVAYLIFWGPLFLVTLFSWGDYKTDEPSASHEVTLHVAFVHAFVNPTLFLALHKGLRRATIDLLCCNFQGGQPAQPAGELASASAAETASPDVASFPYFETGSGRGRSGLAEATHAPIASVNRTYM